jgi:transcription elongation factor Elf1
MTHEVVVCPHCLKKALSIDMKKAAGKATIKCSKCRVTFVYELSELDELVDVYGTFVDDYHNRNLEDKYIEMPTT